MIPWANNQQHKIGDIIEIDWYNWEYLDPKQPGVIIKEITHQEYKKIWKELNPTDNTEYDLTLLPYTYLVSTD